jgi:signal transduction histidine kinase
MAVRLGVPESVAGVTLVRRLAWVTGSRVILLLVALGALAVLNVERGFTFGSTTVQIVVITLAAAFALAGVYAALLRRGRGLELLASTQLVLDQVTWTVLVYVTGGLSSGATSFYGLTCLLGAFLIGERGAAIAGVAGVACYCFFALLRVTGFLGSPPDQDPRVHALAREQTSYHVVVTVLVIVVVTLLASYLAERLRSAGGRIVAAEARAEHAERLAVLGGLAAGLAHEIRNPLGSIAGSIGLLRANTGLSAEDKKLCDIISRETARLNDLVTDMMDVSKPRKPEKTTVNVARVAREVVELASTSGRSASDVVVTYSGEVSAGTEADSAQLRQLIWNLVRNGVQASRAGGIVRVSVTDQDGMLVLEVRDDGVGIDEEAKERLFDAFFTTRSHGTGIGLAVVKRIADDHGFPIEVESSKGSGATFRVLLGPRRSLDFDRISRSSLPGMTRG